MATLYSDLFTQRSFEGSDYQHLDPPTPQFKGQTLSVFSTFTLAAALAAADRIKFCTMPPNCKPVGFKLWSDDLDSGTDITAQLGYMDDSNTVTDDPNAFLVTGAYLQTESITTSEAAIAVCPTTFKDFAGLAVPVDIELGIVAGPSTASSGTIQLLWQYTSV